MHSDPNADQLALEVDGTPTPNDSSAPSTSAVTEPSTPPSSSANALDALLNEYRARATSEREKGTLFEELTRQFLLHDARFAHQFKDVYLWGEWPEHRTGDTGIDLVAIEGQQIPVSRITLADLRDSDIDWCTYSLGSMQAPKTRERKVPRDHQVRARSAVMEGFTKHDRGTMVMACGTGKTFTALPQHHEAAMVII